jgi:hypothetical protein
MSRFHTTLPFSRFSATTRPSLAVRKSRSPTMIGGYSSSTCASHAHLRLKGGRTPAWVGRYRRRSFE